MHIIFIHGSGNTGVVWEHQTDHFVDAEAPNLPGHLADGKACTSVEDYARWLHGYVRERGYEQPVLGGHSLGGAIVLQYALEYPQDLGGLILIGTGAKLRVAPHVLAAIEKGIKDPDSWLAEFIEPQLRLIADSVVDVATMGAGMDDSLRQRMLSEAGEVGARIMVNDFLCCDRFNVMARLSEIQVPTLVLSGSADVLTPPKYGAFLADNIEGARHVVIEGGTHYMYAEKPEQTNRAIGSFLKAL
jgi:pimeloyl-ACP methyl ester carboxylesterase